MSVLVNLLVGWSAGDCIRRCCCCCVLQAPLTQRRRQHCVTTRPAGSCVGPRLPSRTSQTLTAPQHSRKNAGAGAAAAAAAAGHSKTQLLLPAQEQLWWRQAGSQPVRCHQATHCVALLTLPAAAGVVCCWLVAQVPPQGA